MRVYVITVIAVAITCWAIEGLTTWTWPIGTTGTVIMVLGLMPVAARWFRNLEAARGSSLYDQAYIDRKVKKYRDGNIVG